MALARVVTFDGVSKDRMEEMDREMREGQPPEGFPSSELIVLHDPEAEQSLVVVIFETEDDYRRRRDAERDAGRRHTGAAHVGDEVQRRCSHDELASLRSGGDATTA